jgi:hypothetical protein
MLKPMMITCLNPVTFRLKEREPVILKKGNSAGGREVAPVRGKIIILSNTKAFTPCMLKKGVQPAQWHKIIDCYRRCFKCTAYFNMDRRLQLCLEFWELDCSC